MQQGLCSAEQFVAFFGAGTANVDDLTAVDMRLHPLSVVRFILNNAGQDKLFPGGLGNLDRFDRPFVVMNTTEEEEVIAPLRHACEVSEVDTMIDRSHVIKIRRPVRVADGDVVRLAVVFSIDGQNGGGREAVDRRYQRCTDEIAVGEWQEIEVVVDEIELVGPLKDLRDMKTL